MGAKRRSSTKICIKVCQKNLYARSGWL